MTEPGSEFKFLALRTYIRIDISISIRPRTTKRNNELHRKKLTQVRVIKQVSVTSSRQDHVTN